MVGGRNYTGAGVVRNPFLWLLFFLFLYFLFFPNVFVVPLGQGPSTPVIEYFLAPRSGEKFQSLVTLQGDRIVTTKKKKTYKIQGGKAFRILFLSSLLCFQPSSHILKATNLPAITPELQVNFRLGVVSRSFQLLGYKDPSELQGKGMLSLFHTIYFHLTSEGE